MISTWTHFLNVNKLNTLSQWFQLNHTENLITLSQCYNSNTLLPKLTKWPNNNVFSSLLKQAKHATSTVIHVSQNGKHFHCFVYCLMIRHTIWFVKGWSKQGKLHIVSYLKPYTELHIISSQSQEKLQHFSSTITNENGLPCQHCLLCA